ncbi:hypothetical protein M441DRAFT_48244 [Trichoderma asperellum CBS 433.97]|uniref:Uncharacterized protein n=1 Tax=Trichoderma asperellum (strain ATCC 204424 / CBS 433.97 / NBRC 101777) TaxID=1042311 RepID=A0A2T3Z6H9_TRIA4|nr:hypothetical protein M441DRAFT_48244 [Trichoderma asperellum CBS 433.97]PTB40402.1 hypothetical protein M441DRAFT_48244 [Trichoderma asperellum CBS 433.97]
MTTPMSAPHSESFTEPDAIVVMPESDGFIISISNALSPGAVLSLPSTLVVDSGTMATFSEPQYVGTARPSAQTRIAEPSRTKNTSNTMGNSFTAHKVVIIGIAVSLGLACAFSLFTGAVKYRNKKQASSKVDSARKTRDSLEIRCIGINHNVLTEISPASLSKTGVTETKEPLQTAQINK